MKFIHGIQGLIKREKSRKIEQLVPGIRVRNEDITDD